MIPPRRRWARGLALAAALLAVGAAPAQDPRASAAVSAAREWLLLTDRGDAAESHKRAGAKFRAALTVPQWQAALASERAPRGAVVQRAVVQTAFERRLSGVPDGDYAFLQFRTAFDQRSDAGETVTLEREADGAWRVIGYFIK